MDSETSVYVEKAAFSEYFFKMAFCALYRSGSIFRSISQQFLNLFAAKKRFFPRAVKGTKKPYKKIIKTQNFLFSKQQGVYFIEINHISKTGHARAI